MSGSQHTLAYNFLCAANYDNFSKGEREIDAQNERKRKKYRLFSLSLYLFLSLSLPIRLSLFLPSFSHCFSLRGSVSLSRANSAFLLFASQDSALMKTFSSFFRKEEKEGERIEIGTG